MSKRDKDKGRLPPFVALLRDTLASSAWRAMSHGVCACFLAIVAFPNNGMNTFDLQIAVVLCFAAAVSILIISVWWAAR
jgi:hypothetical protein